MKTQGILAAALFCALAFTATTTQASDPASSLGTSPLPSWKDGKTKQSIVAFVEKVTKKGSPDFVPALWQRLLGGQRLSMGDYVTGPGARRGATAAGGRSC